MTELIPLMPRRAVLMPHGFMSIKAHEVRYMDMVKRCVAERSAFGIVRLIEGSETLLPGAPTERFETIGVLARIVKISPEFGSMTISIFGERRFRIVDSSRLKHGLMVVNVESIENDPHVPLPPEMNDVAHLLGLDMRNSTVYSQRDGTGCDGVAPMHLDDCGWVANRWVERLPLTAAQKQQLMEMMDPAQRLAAVREVLVDKGLV